MSSKDDPDTFIINSEESIPECGKWIRRKFAVYKYWTITARAGRKRKAIQNAKLWPTLADISKQVVWYGKTYDEDSWKDILSGSFKKHDSRACLELRQQSAFEHRRIPCSASS